MIKIILEYYIEGSIELQTTIDATEDNYGEISLNKSREEHPRIGNKFELGGEFIFRGDAYEAIKHYSDPGRNRNRSLVVRIESGSTFHIFTATTSKIKWDKERCQVHISDGELGGLMRYYKLLEDVWEDDLDISSLGSTIDLKRSQYRIVELQNQSGGGGVVTVWNVFDITYVNDYEDKLTNFSTGTLVTDATEKANVLSALSLQDPSYSEFVYFYSQSRLPQPTQQGSLVERRVWIMFKDGLELAKRLYDIHEYYENVNGFDIIEYYGAFEQMINDDAKLVGAVKLEDAIEFFLNHHFGTSVILDPLSTFRPKAHGVTNNIYLVQQSNAKRPWAYQPARRYKITLRKLIEDICKSFRIYYLLSRNPSGKYVLSFYNPSNANVQANPANFNKIGDRWSPYLFNANQVTINEDRLLNIYTFLAERPVRDTLIFSQHKRMDAIRDEVVEEGATGSPIEETITYYNLDYRALMFHNFGDNSPYMEQEGYLDYRDKKTTDRPYSNNDIRDIMEKVGNHFYTDEGFLIYTANGAYPNPTASRVNRLNYLSQNRIKWWNGGDENNKTYLTITSGAQELTILSYEQITVKECDLPSEKMEVAKLDGVWYFGSSSSYNLTTRIQSITFESRNIL